MTTFKRTGDDQMLFSKTPFSWLLLFIAFSQLAIGQSGAKDPRPVAEYLFREGTGAKVHDSSGHGLDGDVIGNVQWVEGKDGRGLLLDGTSRVTVPASPLLDFKDSFSIYARIKGTGGHFRLVPEPSTSPSFRGPYFQICGDVIHFTSNSDALDNLTAEEFNKNPTKSYDENLWTGTVDVNLSGWKDVRRTLPPLSGLEPKLQVIGDRIYYEYFGQDSNGIWQIWTATAKADGSDWKTVQRTRSTEGYHVEQGEFQVVGSKIYFDWPAKVGSRWQNFVASSDLEGNAFTAEQQSTDGSTPVRQQIVGAQRFLLVNITWGHKSEESQGAEFALVVSDLDGKNRQVLRRFDRLHVGTGAMTFRVSNSRVYFVYDQNISSGGVASVGLFTASMKTDGTDFHATQQKLADGFAGHPGVPQEGIQIVGNRIYYTLTSSDKEEAGKWNTGQALWTAEADLDGTHWKAVRRSDASVDVQPQYKGLVVVGGKTYLSAAQWIFAPGLGPQFKVHMGTSGSNIVNKGDAFGLGMTEDHTIRGFANVGQDYLFRAEAPADTAGAIADSVIDDDWHQVVVTYDKQHLKLFVDGTLKATSEYRASLGQNPFPLMIGDGFQGLLGEVRVYSVALTEKRVLVGYRSVSN